MNQIKERRKFPRLDKKVTIKYKILTDLERELLPDFQDLVQETVTRNISVQGVCIKTGHYVEPGKILGLEIQFPEIEEPIRGIGKIIWSKELYQKDEYYSGVEFIAMKEKHFDQLTELVAEYFIEKYKLKNETDKLNLKKIFLQFFRRK